MIVLQVFGLLVAGGVLAPLVMIAADKLADFL